LDHKICKYKDKENICEISKKLQFISNLPDEELICELKEEKYSLCPAYEEKEISLKLVK